MVALQEWWEDVKAGLLLLIFSAAAALVAIWFFRYVQPPETPTDQEGTSDAGIH